MPSFPKAVLEAAICKPLFHPFALGLPTLSIVVTLIVQVISFCFGGERPMALLLVLLSCIAIICLMWALIETTVERNKVVKYHKELRVLAMQLQQATLWAQTNPRRYRHYIHAARKLDQQITDMEVKYRSWQDGTSQSSDSSGFFGYTTMSHKLWELNFSIENMLGVMERDGVMGPTSLKI